MIAVLVVGGLTLLSSFLCSLFEAALYSITPAQVELLKAGGHRGGQRLARLRADIEEPIAAILTVNTIAPTVGSTWCGALVADEYGSTAVGIFAAVFTFLVLAATEIVPKSIGVRFANSLGPHVALPIQVMIWMVWPVARPARAIMRWLTGSAGPQGPSEDELVVSARLAASTGQLRPEEHEWVTNALLLDRVKARDVLTPRTVLEMLPADLTVDEAVEHWRDWVHSRIPLHAHERRDELVGVVHRRDVHLAALAGEGHKTLADFQQPLDFVPETMAGDTLLRKFLRERRHLVELADEYGGLLGVVTL